MKAPAPHRVAAIARRGLRAHVRSRLILWTLLLGVVGWMAAPDLRAGTRSAVVLVLFYTIGAVLLLGAGALADDMASGAYMLDLVHGAAPADFVLGTCCAILAGAVPTWLALAAGLVSHADPTLRWLAVGLAVWSAIAAAGWSTLLVLFATMVPGKANAGLLAPLFLFGGFGPDDLPLGALPAMLADAVRWVWALLPLQAHVGAIRDGFLGGAPPGLTPYLALVAGPVACLALAIRRLGRLEPVSRWTL